MARKTVKLADVSWAIQDADLLLFRGTGTISKLISAAGRSPYTHAGLAVWIHGLLFCVEVREFYGGRAVMLASQVEKLPGRIDVFETNPNNRWTEFDKFDACYRMLKMAGSPYGYWSVLRATIPHLPFIRLKVKPVIDDEQESVGPPFCSQAIAIACRFGGVDPVPHLPDRLTEPADLAQSPFFQFRFTLEG